MAVAGKMKAGYMECSAKEMIGVDEIFLKAINIVVANDPSNQVPQSRGKSSPAEVDGSRPKKKKRSCKIL